MSTDISIALKNSSGETIEDLEEALDLLETVLSLFERILPSRIEDFFEGEDLFRIRALLGKYGSDRWSDEENEVE